MNASTDRIAFIALMFLIVIVAVAAFWDDGDPVNAAVDDDTKAEVVEDQVPTFTESRGGAPVGNRQDEGPVSPTDDLRFDRPTGTDGRIDGGSAPTGRGGSELALSGLDETKPEDRDPSTRGLAFANHRVEPRSQEAPLVPVTNEPLRPQTASGNRRGNGIGFINTRRTDDRDSASPRSESRQGTQASPSRESKQAKVEPKKRPKAAPASTKSRTYEVRNGDSLSLIAIQQCGGEKAMLEIVRLNGLSDPDMIYAGMKLKLPTKVAGGGDQPKAAKSASGRRTIKIKSGDVLSTLLDKECGSYRRSIELVKELNPKLNPDVLTVGQTIVLPNANELPNLPSGKRVADSTKPSSRESSARGTRAKKNYVR